MTQTEMFKTAKWIDCENGTEAPVFLKKFNAVKGENAVITICGLGVFDIHINGKRVSDDLLVPCTSQYSYRDMSKWSYPIFDDLSFRTYCVKYDISGYLADGENVMEIMLGGGFYHQDLRLSEGNVTYGTPKLCYLIEKGDELIISDETTLCHPGYFRRCNLYYGEFQDFSACPSESDFLPSRIIDTPETEFCLQTAPADKVVETIDELTFLGEYDVARYYDCGINTVGRVALKCEIPGEYVKIEYAEEIGGDEYFGIHFSDCGRYTDEFITSETQSEYKTRFGWQGFRYFRIYGKAEPVRVDVIHTDIKVTSSFESDNEVLNWLYKTYIHTQLCNIHCAIPSDCPHRERLGYTGDGQLCAHSGMLLFDSREFYRKWLYDISDSQCKKSGHVQHTAPFMGGGGGPCGWGGAIVEVPYRYYKIYGDKSVLEEFYPKILRYFEYLDNHSFAGLVFSEEKGGWCLGDWLPPTPIQIPETYVNTCLYIRFLQQTIEIAEIIGKQNDIPAFEEKIAKIKEAVNAAYYSFQQRSYCGDINGASSLALDVGLGDDRVKAKVIEKYTGNCQYDTGIIATDVLTRYLFDIGENQLAFDLLTNGNDVSFSHMMKSGATTIWENWNGQSSRNHPMFGAVTQLLFTRLLGIKQTDDSAGFEKIIISPVFVNGMDFAKGSIETVNGKISAEYHIDGDTAQVKVFADERIDARFICGDKNEKFSGEATFNVKVTR